MYETCFICGTVDNDLIQENDNFICHECIERKDEAIRQNSSLRVLHVHIYV